MEAHRTQPCISWRKARCRMWNEMPEDDGVGAHPHGGDAVEAPGSPTGEQRKCRGVGAGPAPRPLLLAELLPPPGGRADAQSRGRARRGAAGRTGPDEAQREAALAGGGAGSGSPCPAAQRGALGSVPRAAARRQPWGIRGGGAPRGGTGEWSAAEGRAHSFPHFAPTMQFLVPPILRVCSEASHFGDGNIEASGRSKTYPGAYSSLK